MGERSPVALVSPAAAARMAVGEAVMNISAADIDEISVCNMLCERKEQHYSRLYQAPGSLLLSR